MLRASNADMKGAWARLGLTLANTPPDRRPRPAQAFRPGHAGCDAGGEKVPASLRFALISCSGRTPAKQLCCYNRRPAGMQSWRCTGLNSSSSSGR